MVKGESYFTPQIDRHHLSGTTGIEKTRSSKVGGHFATYQLQFL